jgi:cytochrome c biogenesis protein CcdA
MAERSKNDGTSKFDINTKFMRVLLMILTVVLIFVGPTYIPYLLFDIVHVNYIASIITGFVLFVAGLLLMWFLIRKKIIT